MIDKIIYHKNLSYFVSSIIPLMSISIFLADLFVVILSLIFLIFILKNKMLTNFQNLFFILSLIFYMVCVTSSLLSEYILFSLKSSLTLIRVIILIMFISFLLEKKENFDQILYEYMKYTLFFLSFYGIFFYIYEIIFYDPSYVRLKLPFTDEAKLGSYLIRLYPLLLALFLIKKNKTRNENIFFLFISLLVCLTVILSGERTAFFFLILVVSLCVIFIETKPKIKKIFFFYDINLQCCHPNIKS